MSKLFKDPDIEQDSKFVEDEERRNKRRRPLFDEYKPKPSTDRFQVENRIRILRARADSKGTYYLRIGRHFIKHNDYTEMFICPKETVGDPCPACEAYVDLKKKKSEHADKYKPQIRGVFNVINRNEENPHVQIYFSPMTTVCKRVVDLVRSGRSMSDIFDNIEDDFSISKPGRDLILIYKEKTSPGEMYSIYPFEKSPLGDPKQVEMWYSEIKDLTVEGLWGKMISYEDAYIKTFGSIEERQALRERWQKEQQEREDKEFENSQEETAVKDDDVAEMGRKVMEELDKEKENSGSKLESVVEKTEEKAEEKAEEKKENISSNDIADIAAGIAKKIELAKKAMKTK